MKLGEKKLTYLKLVLWLLSSTTNKKRTAHPSELRSVCGEHTFPAVCSKLHACALPQPPPDLCPLGVLSRLRMVKAAYDISGLFVLIFATYLKEIFLTVVGSSQIGASYVHLNSGLP